jgi:hypothetical protein
MYQQHSNIGMYRAIAISLSELLENSADQQDVLNDYNSKSPSNSKITMENIDEIRQDVQRLVSLTQSGISVLNLLLKRNVTQ